MIKAILIDFGGVLGPDSNDWDHNFKIIKTLTKLTAKQINPVFELHWPLLKVGKARTISLWKDISRLSPLSPSPTLLETAYLNATSINPVTFQIATDLPRNITPIFILSNEAREWMDFKINKFKLKTFFSKIYCSAHLGIAKPDINIYQYVIKDLAIKPQESLFIDNLDYNLPPAEQLGINTIRYQNPTQLKKALISHLAR